MAAHDIRRTAVTATILDLSGARVRTNSSNHSDDAELIGLTRIAQRSLSDTLGAITLQCEAQSRWLDRPEPDILEARLCLEALRDDVSRVRELVDTLIG
jgi:hypothetical protein